MLEGISRADVKDFYCYSLSQRYHQHYWIWDIGDREQSQSISFINNCTEGMLCLIFSDCKVPIYLDSTEKIV